MGLQTKRLTATMGGSDTEEEREERRSSGKAKRHKRHMQHDDDDDDDEDGVTNYEKKMEHVAKVSAEQRQLLEMIRQEGEELERPDSKRFDEVLSNVNRTFKEGAREDVRVAGMDATMMRMLSEKMAKQASNIGASNSRINPGLLATRLKRFFGAANDSEVDFARLGQEVKVFFRALPTCDFMLGALDVKPPEKKEKAKREAKSSSKISDHPVEKPQDLSAGTTTTSKKTTSSSPSNKAEGSAESSSDLFKLHSELQNEMSKAVTSKGRAGMFETVMDPSSFTQTVENIFALTFLVKDGVMLLEVDEEDKMPKVEAIKASNPLVAKANKTESQFIASFSMSDWERIREEFDIKKGLMKHREQSIYDDVPK